MKNHCGAVLGIIFLRTVVPLTAAMYLSPTATTLSVFGLQLNAENKKMDKKILRGGSWLFNFWYSRYAARLQLSPGIRNDGNGFRIAIKHKEQENE